MKSFLYIRPSTCLSLNHAKLVDRFNRNFAQRRLTYAVHSYIDPLPFQGDTLLYSKATVLKETTKSHCRDFFIQLKIMNLPVYLSINAQSHIKKNIKNFKLNADGHEYHLPYYK